MESESIVHRLWFLFATKGRERANKPLISFFFPPRVLFGTAWLWFALDVAFYGLGLNSSTSQSESIPFSAVDVPPAAKFVPVALSKFCLRSDLDLPPRERPTRSFGKIYTTCPSAT